jgi:hypothetical protein
LIRPIVDRVLLLKSILIDGVQQVGPRRENKLHDMKHKKTTKSSTRSSNIPKGERSNSDILSKIDKKDSIITNSNLLMRKGIVQTLLFDISLVVSKPNTKKVEWDEKCPLSSLDDDDLPLEGRTSNIIEQIEIVRSSLVKTLNILAISLLKQADREEASPLSLSSSSYDTEGTKKCFHKQTHSDSLIPPPTPPPPRPYLGFKSTSKFNPTPLTSTDKSHFISLNKSNSEYDTLYGEGRQPFNQRLKWGSVLYSISESMIEKDWKNNEYNQIKRDKLNKSNSPEFMEKYDESMEK